VKRLLLGLLAALLLVPGAAALTEKLVFQANQSAPAFGFQVFDDAESDTCRSPYTAETCISFFADAFTNQYLARSLAGEKHAYRIHFWIYAADDGAQAKLRVAFSLAPNSATTAMKGNGHDSGAWAESVQAIFWEEPVGWQVKLAQVHNGGYQELATISDARPSSAWQGFDFVVNTDTGQLRITNDLGNTVLSATMTEAKGRAIHSQWFRQTGGGFAGEWLWMRTKTLQIYDQDPRAPIITELAQTPLRVFANQAVKVTANITDDWGSASAVLHTWINNEQGADVAMTHSGTRYEATLPGRPDGVEVRYQVEATAVSGLKAVSDTIRYVVGSEEDPDNLGGGSLGAAEDLGFLGVGVFAIFVVGGLVLTFLDMASKPNGAPKAYLYAVGGMVLGLLWLAYIYNKPAIDDFLTSPAAWFLALAGLVVAVLAVSFKGRPTP
jgi:hypothetical protein